MIQKRAGNVWNSENQQRRSGPPVCRIVIGGTGVRPVRPPLRDWGAFQLVGSFPGCHHHTPRPSLTILRQRAVSLKQSRCRFAELWNKWCSWHWWSKLNLWRKNSLSSIRPLPILALLHKNLMMHCNALHTSQFQSSKNSAGLPLSVHAQYNTIYRRVNRIALQFRLHCDELDSTAPYQCTAIMQSNICNIATQHITIVYSVQQSLYQWIACSEVVAECDSALPEREQEGWHASWERGRGWLSQVPPTRYLYWQYQPIALYSCKLGKGEGVSHCPSHKFLYWQ